MPGIWIPQPDGTFQAAKGLWITDPGGTFKPAQGAWVTKPDGSFGKVWPLGASIASFSAAAGSPSYSAVKLTWSGTAITRYELRLLGSQTLLYSGTGTTYTVTGLLPQSVYNFTLRAYAADGSYSDSTPVTWTTTALPAPSGFQRAAGDYHQSYFTWNAVPGASSYDLLDTLHGNAVKATVPLPSMWETGLGARTVYERAVRAKIGASFSPLSAKLRYTTPAPPSAAPGSYGFPAVSAQTWAPGIGAWRPASDGLYAGNGANWGDRNGNQVAVAFYGSKPWLTKLQGARCTRFKVSIRRDGGTGISSPQAITWWLHDYTGRPAGAPSLATGFVVAGSVAKGQTATIDLPVAWGQALLEGLYSGIAMGFVPNSYLRADPVANVSGQLGLYFTVG